MIFTCINLNFHFCNLFLRRERKIERKTGAFLLFAVYFDCRAEVFDNRFDDGQPQACTAAAGGIAAFGIERFKDAVDFVGRNADAVIGYFDFDFRAFSAGFDFQIATVGHGLESVLNQVYQCHFEVAFRAADV